jgi:hypothetical protein
MNFLPSFTIWPFAVAGAVAAAGPIIIHLLNRRRFRILPWAAMEFLKQALQRSRRWLQMRDLIILLLRTLAVLFVGLALAQPFFADRVQEFDGTRPLHAVLVLDNSLSMGYGSLEGTLLDRAKERAKQFIDRLPADSRVSVIPLCGSQAGYSPDALTKENAREAIDQLELVDRSASIQRALNESQKACASGPMLAKRIVVFSDQQLANWKDISGAEQFADLPPVQLVDVSAGEWENTWISDLRIQDGVADVDTPTTFIVEVRHEGGSGRREVPVTLSVDGAEVASKTVTLEPGLGTREIAFQHVFSIYRPEPGQPIAVPVKAALPPDKLPADDERHLVVHVVAALPVVFVDQYGAKDEDPVKKRLGETRHLRKLLAPVTSRRESPRQLVRIRHLRFDQLEQDAIEDARLVVIAGIADPGDKVELLREYVEQGGQLLIAAGGEHDPANNAGFDPQRWTEAAWLDGGGILPAPLLRDALGATPSEAGANLKTFFLSYSSLGSHQYFQLADVAEAELRDLYAEALFFKAVQADVSDEMLQTLAQAEIKRIEDGRRLLADTANLRRRFADLQTKGALTEEEQTRLREDEARLRQLQPGWLLWKPAAADADDDDLPADPEQRARRLEELAQRTRPRVLARFDNAAGTPFLVERRIGRGTVLLATTGLLSDWNTLPQTNTFLIFDRILRSMILTTLPQRSFAAAERLTLPLPPGQREVTVTLRRPGQEAAEILDTGFIGREQLGFSIPRPLTRGLYRVSASGRSAAGGAGPETLWELPLSVNGDAVESELTSLTRDQFEQRVAGATNVRWVGPAEDISLAGNQIRGQDSWWWLILAIVALLALELALLGVPVWRTRLQPEPA